jgi:hypothetical protein
MKFLKYLFMGVFFLSAPMALTACEQESALEESTENIEEGAEEISDEIDDATTD